MLALVRRFEQVARQADPLGKDPFRLADLNHATAREGRTPHLEFAELSGLNLSYVKLNRASLAGARLNDANVSHAAFANANLRHAQAVGMFATEANFNGSNMRQATFDQSRLSGSTFVEADLSFAQLNGMTAQRTSFERACLQSAVATRGDFRSAQFSNANCTLTDFRSARLRSAVFYGTDLGGANLEKADLLLADLSGARIFRTRLVNTKGLFGPSRAQAKSAPIDEHEAQGAVYHSAFVRSSAPLGGLSLYRADYVSWERLRAIGVMRLFGVSYFTIAAITIYAGLADAFNRAIDAARLAANRGDAIGTLNSQLAALPHAPLPPHLGRQLIATMVLALAATIYAIRCPSEVKEATEVRWTRAMGQPLWEYRSANWSRRWARVLTATCFAAGGGYSLVYLVTRSIEAFGVLIRAASAS